MTTKEYITLSAKFENNSVEMADRVKENADLIHAALGISDEYFEFFLESMLIGSEKRNNLSPNEIRTGLIKEVGDILWYIAIICRKFNIEITMDSLSDDDILYNINNSLQRIVSSIKKYAIYGKEINIEDLSFHINLLVRELITALNNIIDETIFGHELVSLSDVMERNIEKLTARYGEKYTNEAAINKDETNE